MGHFSLNMFMSIMFLVFLQWNSCVLVGSLNDEGFALMSFKNSTTDPGGYLQNWNNSDANPCAWHGVTCKQEKVVSLSIPNNNLVGFLPPSLGNLSALRHVNLKNNKLFGTLPVELFNATGLRTLILSNNSFSGPVPCEIGKIRFLQSLDFSQNFFNSSIPSSLQQCSGLKMLVLSQNHFTGSLPDGFGTFLALQKLDLSFNRLTGPIRHEIGNLTSLQGTLDLSHNFFTGPVPETLGALSEYLYIDLSYNNLSGQIPQDGVLSNIGPPAFMGNPLLCGPPLKTLCSQNTVDNSELINYPSQNSASSSSKPWKSSKILVIIVVCTFVGVFLAGFLLAHMYQKKGRSAGKKIEHVGCTSEERSIVKKDSFFCFASSDLENISENMDQYIFVPLGLQIGFDLEKLLKANAFLLGKSGMGIVYRVVLEDGLSVAVRRLADEGSQRFKDFQSEVEAIGKIKHPNIVALRAYCWSAEDKLLIYDYIPNGDLATALHGKAGAISFTPLSWPIRLKIMKGIAKGLSYLHEFSPKRFVHGDLKPSNILIGHNMEPYISDFGLGRLATPAGDSSSTFTFDQIISPSTPEPNSPFEFSTTNSPVALGSPYQAPEASKIAKPSQKRDVYAFGLILLEIVTGKLPTVQLGSVRMDLVEWMQLCIEQRKLICDVLDPYLVHDLDMEDEVVDVIKLSLACVHKIPEKRPSMRYVSETLDKLDTSTN